MAKWGTMFREDDVVQVNLSTGLDYWHESLLRKDCASDKDLHRDYSDFDASAELSLIRKCILRCYRRVFGKFWASDQLEDFTLEVFMHLWVRDCYRRYDASLSNYETYLQRAVHNCLVDIAKSITVQQFRSSVSLNQTAGEEGEELLNMIKDVTVQDTVEKLQADALYERMHIRVLELDSVVGGLPGFTYKRIFDALVEGTMADFIRSYPYDRGVLDTYVSKLRRELELVCYEFVG
jgi:DNA-directed RNA polymerase specialized sigma24 family protein